MGSASSRRRNCSRRRSPPDRSLTRVCWRGAGEAEPLGQRAGADLLVAEPGVLADVLDRLDHPPVGHLVQLADLLGQVGHRHRLAHLAQAAAERDVTVDRPHQRRLPGAVDPDDADPVAGREPPGDPLQQLAAAQGHRRVDQVDDVLAQARGGEPDQVDLVAGRRLVLDQRRGGLDAELGLAGPRRRAAAQPGQLLAQQVAPSLLGDGLHPVALRLGQHVRRVATVVGVDLPLGHLPGGRGHGVEEPPVVGDGDEGGAAAGAPGGQVVGQPGHPLDVEVVGRLVQQQQVGVGHEQLGQREPSPLTAGHRPDQRLQAPTSGASMPPSRPSSTSRTRASPAQTCSGVVPSTAVRTVASGSSVSTCVSMPTVRPPTLVTRPSSTS